MPRITLSDRIIGDRLRKARNRKGLTLDDVAAIVGVGPVTLSRWERSADRFPPARAASLSEALNIPLAELKPGLVIEITPDEHDLLAAYRKIADGAGRVRVMVALEMARRAVVRT